MNLIKKLQLIQSKIVYYTLFVLGKTSEQLWKKKLAELLVDVPEDKLKIYEAVLNNQHAYNQQYLTERDGGPDTENIAKLVLDSLTTMDLIGVQPMAGPAGLLFQLKVKQPEDGGDTNIRRVSLEVTSQDIEARSYKLQAGYTIEAAQDLNNMHGLDIKNELEHAIAREIASEIALEHIKDLVTLSEKQEIIVGSAGAIVHLIAKGNDIARETRRGTGNRLVLSPALFARLDLKNNPEFVAEESKAEEMRGPVSLLYVGTLRQIIKVYVGGGIDDNTALIGYKGASEIDAGLFYAPHVMVLMGGPVIDPETFSPIMMFMTRYGKHRVENASAYYKSVTFKFEEPV